MPCETAVEGEGGWWWDGVDKVVVAVGLCIRKRELEGLGVKNPKPSLCGSVSGAPCKTAVECGGGGWREGADEVVVAAGLRICKRKAGR
jgi:hypothetical protein